MIIYVKCLRRGARGRANAIGITMAIGDRGARKATRNAGATQVIFLAINGAGGPVAGAAGNSVTNSLSGVLTDGSNRFVLTEEITARRPSKRVIAGIALFSGVDDAITTVAPVILIRACGRIRRIDVRPIG